MRMMTLSSTMRKAQALQITSERPQTQPRVDAVPVPLDSAFMVSDRFLDLPDLTPMEPPAVIVGLRPLEHLLVSRWIIVVAPDAAAVRCAVACDVPNPAALPEFSTWFRTRQSYGSQCRSTPHNLYESGFCHLLCTSVAAVDPRLHPVASIYQQLGIHRVKAAWDKQGQCIDPEEFRLQVKYTFERNHHSTLTRLATWPAHRLHGLMGLVWGALALFRPPELVAQMQHALTSIPLCQEQNVRFHTIKGKESADADNARTLAQYNVVDRRDVAGARQRF
jgi:hypothetical protein